MKTRKLVNVQDLRKNSSLTIVFIVTLVFIAYLFVTQSLTVVQLRYQMSDEKETRLQLENENKLLQEKIERMTTDQYVEEKARVHLGMVKSNETPVKIVETEKPEDQTPEARVVQPKEKIGIYMKDWYIKIEEWIEFLKK